VKSPLVNLLMSLMPDGVVIWSYCVALGAGRCAADWL
jgi:hypothetical protein